MNLVSCSCLLCEILLWVGAAIGIFLAYSEPNNPLYQLHIISLWVTTSIAGFTGIESLFFAKEAAKQIGYETGSSYQRQSGFFNIALAMTMLLVYHLGWSLDAQAPLLIVLLLFLSFSALNHAYSAIKEHNRSIKNALRPIMTVLLLAAIVPIVFKALKMHP